MVDPRAVAICGVLGGLSAGSVAGGAKDSRNVGPGVRPALASSTCSGMIFVLEIPFGNPFSRMGITASSDDPISNDTSCSYCVTLTFGIDF